MSLITKIGSLFKGQAVSASSPRSFEILKAMGGAHNLSDVDACISSLRVTVRDQLRVDEERLKMLGAAAITKSGNNMQVFFGMESDHIREEIEKEISLVKVGTSVKQKLFLCAPLSGRLVPLSQVPDQAFSQKIMGDGFAIDPTDGIVLAPIDATVVQIFRTGHAIGLETESGVEILIHVGIDTVKLNGKGFTALVQNGQHVKAGQELIRFDLELIRGLVPSMITPIVFTNMERIASIQAKSKGEAKAGEEIASLELQV
ncbi:MAG: glucose PTS transporter subunit IIA [Bdellovibrionota bacterium]